MGTPREAAPGMAAPSECLLRSSPVILTGGQIPNVLFDEEVGLWHKAGDTSGCLRGVPGQCHTPASTVPVGASCAPWPAPQSRGQGMDLGSAVSPRPAYPPATATCPTAPPPLLALRRALRPAVLTILPPMALMCCCSVSQCLSCWSAAYCNKAARTELSTGDRPFPKSPLLQDAAPRSALPPAPPALLQPQPWLWQTRHLGGHVTPLARVPCASQTLGTCSEITNKGTGEEVNKGAEAHASDSHGKPSGCGT